MNKIIVLSLILTFGFISCKNSEKEMDKIKIAKQYYHVLDNSDYSGITAWFSDTLTTIEGEYKQTYSQS